MLPLAVPGIVLAFGYLAMTQEGKLLGQPNLHNQKAYKVKRLYPPKAITNKE